MLVTGFRGNPHIRFALYVGIIMTTKETNSKLYKTACLVSLLCLFALFNLYKSFIWLAVGNLLRYFFNGPF